MRPLLEISDATIAAPGGRVLFADLSACVGHERVALVGRNGVGKSTLLDVLAGVADLERGRVRTACAPTYVPQRPEGPVAMSAGERRRRALEGARAAGAEVVLLDEPSEDLDDAAVGWLREWIRSFAGCLLVASHDRRILAEFDRFFVATESGCRYVEGTIDDVDALLEREHRDGELRYARTLRCLAEHEEASLHLARRKARKQRYGRCSELDRCTPRIRLNQKRSEAQESHGRLARLREAKSDALREWSRSTRRALSPRLELELQVPAMPEPTGPPVVAREVSVRVGATSIVERLDLAIERQRIAVVGRNGAGKTTLLETLLGQRRPATGSVVVDRGRIGAIGQGAADYQRDESLLEHLASRGADLDALAMSLVAHKFPLALAERPLRSLSPGERARAALIALFRSEPTVELLVLDEPTYGLDLVGQRAMTRALRAWPGGLVVASHDVAFLEAIGVERWIEL